MEDYEEVERYQKILEDWNPGRPTSPKQKPRPSVTSTQTFTSQPLAVTMPTPVNGTEYGCGAILLLDGRTLVIYKRFVPEKEYHLVFVLCPNNAVKIQGIALEGHQVEELGSISSNRTEQLANEMRWDRDLIVFHCYRFEDVAKIPGLENAEENWSGQVQQAEQTAQTSQALKSSKTNGSTAPAVKIEKPNAEQLRRGQRLHIKFGSNTWDAVYWGKDDQGQVIAHRTYERWALMHLDLNRFSNGLEINPEVDLGLIHEVEESLSNG